MLLLVRLACAHPKTPNAKAVPEHISSRRTTRISEGGVIVLPNVQMGHRAGACHNQEGEQTYGSSDETARPIEGCPSSPGWAFPSPQPHSSRTQYPRSMSCASNSLSEDAMSPFSVFIRCFSLLSSESPA